jgi:hypothetical protein
VAAGKNVPAKMCPTAPWGERPAPRSTYRSVTHMRPALRLNVNGHMCL